VTDDLSEKIDINTSIDPPQSTFITIRYYNEFPALPALENQKYYTDFPI